MNQPSLAGLVSSLYGYPGLRPGLSSGRPFRGWSPVAGGPIIPGYLIRMNSGAVQAGSGNRSLRELLVEPPILLVARIVCGHNVSTRAPVLAFLNQIGKRFINQRLELTSLAGRKRAPFLQCFRIDSCCETSREQAENTSRSRYFSSKVKLSCNSTDLCAASGSTTRYIFASACLP
jgi:hypothetical protein